MDIVFRSGSLLELRALKDNPGIPVLLSLSCKPDKIPEGGYTLRIKDSLVGGVTIGKSFFIVQNASKFSLLSLMDFV